MGKRNRRIRRAENSLPPGPDPASLQAFYRSSGQLVEQQFAAALETDLRAAVQLVLSVEDDHWSW
jgi:hypothetical protein